jgi:hypothetical protein
VSTKNSPPSGHFNQRIAKTQFLVVYREKCGDYLGPWRPYSPHLYTYMAACEESARLQAGSDVFQFKPIHQKLVRRAA